MNIKPFFVLFLICYIASSQNKQPQVVFKYQKDTLYINETNEDINKRVYNLKVKSNLFAGLRFENDTLVLYKLRFSHLFGTLENSKKNQLFKLISSKNKVDTTKIIIIHYQDTLKRISQFAKKTGIVFNKDSTSHRHVISHKTFINQHKKCVRTLGKRNKSQVYHYYNFNNGHPETYKKVDWYKDNLSLIDKIFRDSYRRFNTIIIHPNGDFFCRNYNDENSNIFKDITKGKRWKKHKKEFEESLDTLNSMF